ncbi:MAG TPA: hypothetical protein ENK18_04060 [Deltaproteobacteria bacterium]|nr:hypothetical protein [Deltaproteobacteria bacterium]
MRTIQPPWSLSVILLLTSCYSRSLEGPEILALLSDAEIEGHHTLHGYSFERSYDPGGTFVQHRKGRTEPETARWWVQGHEICIRWDDQDRSLCRALHTDDRGHLWKVMRKHNGSTERIVTYTSVVGPGGEDRLAPIATSAYLRRWSRSTPALLSGLSLAGLGLVSGMFVSSRGDDPQSLGNRLSWWLPWTIGGRWIWPPRLGGMAEDKLDELTFQALVEREHVLVAWIYAIMRRQAPDEEAAWSRLWSFLSSMEDEEIGAVLRSLLHAMPGTDTLAVLLSGNDRALWLVSHALGQRARTLRSNPTRFEADKQAAISLLTPLRDRASAAPEPLSTPARGGGSDHYAALAGPELEGLLYLTAYTSSSRGSSSYSGGG